MSEKIANVAEFKAMKDDGKPFLGNGGSVGKHDTYPPSPQKWSLSSLMGSLTRERERSPLRLRLPLTILPVLMRRNFRQQSFS
jgi:hypothetical protein